jgi:small-conductance mechanosensitive channel
MSWQEIKEMLGTGWVLGPLVFVVWVTAGFVAKHLAFRRLRRLARKTKTKIDDVLVHTLNLPLNLLIVFAGLFITEKLLPLKGTGATYLAYAMKIVLILVVIFLFDQLVKGLVVEYGRKSALKHLTQGAIQGVFRGLIFVIGGIILLDSLGVNISPLVASLGITSLAVALALQPTLSNLFSGLSISLDRSIQVGDLIELENEERGYIENIGWRASRIRLISDNLIVIPNSKLVDSVLKNYEAPESKTRIYLRCGVHYESDLAEVEKITLELAQEAVEELDVVDRSFAPRFRYEEFAGSSINFCLVMRAPDYLARLVLTHEMIKRIHKRFDERGINIPYPLRTLDLQPKHEEMLHRLAGKQLPD